MHPWMKNAIIIIILWFCLTHPVVVEHLLNQIMSSMSTFSSQVGQG